MIENPIPGYKFTVTLLPAVNLPATQAMQVPPVVLGAFQEASGLGGQLEVMAYAEGGLNDFVHQLPVRHSWSRITLKRGLVRDLGLYYWYAAGLSQSLGARRDGSVTLLTPAGVPAMTWMFFGGVAAKWSGPQMNAMQNAVAVESLEIAHHGLMQMPLSPPLVG